MAGLSDILTAIQNGVTALNNLGAQVRGSFNNILGQLAVLQTPACFNANKNNVNQTGIADATFTAVTFGTELYDVGSHFASDGWTPPAGKIHLDVSMQFSGTFVTGNQIAGVILKNGAFLMQSNGSASAVWGGGQVMFSANDIANGTDVYTIQMFADVSAGTVTVNGNPLSTFFSGYWVSA